MRCKSLVVHYDAESKSSGMKTAQPGPGGSSSIKKLEALGGVHVTQKEQTATGDKGLFDMKSNSITLSGNVLITPTYSVFPSMGILLTMKGFAVMIVGGYGRVNATVLAACLLGVAEALGTGFISSGYADAFAFIAMIIVLLLAPQGLFGRKVGI